MKQLKKFKQVLKQPPSLNTLFRSVKGRSIKSKAYREYTQYFNDASISVLDELEDFYLSDKRRMKLILKINFKRKNSDIDNYLKCLLDCCHGYYFYDDQEINELTVIRLTEHEAKELNLDKGYCLLEVQYYTEE